MAMVSQDMSVYLAHRTQLIQIRVAHGCHRILAQLLMPGLVLPETGHPILVLRLFVHLNPFRLQSKRKNMQSVVDLLGIFMWEK